MYKIEFYKTRSGKIPVSDFIRNIRNKHGDKEIAGIRLYIDLLEKHGMTINNFRPHAIRPISGDLYELRPGSNRIFFFYHKDNVFVFLHAYRKQKQDAPKFEIETAKKRMAEYKRRF